MVQAATRAGATISTSNAIPFLYRLILVLACEERVRALYAGDRSRTHNWLSMSTDLIERIMAIAGSLRGSNPDTNYALHYHSPADPTTNLQLEAAANQAIVEALLDLDDGSRGRALAHPGLQWVILSGLTFIARHMESVSGWRLSTPTHVKHYLEHCK